VKETQADGKETNAMVKDIVNRMNAQDCSYPLELVAILVGTHQRHSGGGATEA
jgi:hypothetical protein